MAATVLGWVQWVEPTGRPWSVARAAGKVEFDGDGLVGDDAGAADLVEHLLDGGGQIFGVGGDFGDGNGLGGSVLGPGGPGEDQRRSGSQREQFASSHWEQFSSGGRSVGGGEAARRSTRASHRQTRVHGPGLPIVAERRNAPMFLYIVEYTNQLVGRLKTMILLIWR